MKRVLAVCLTGLFPLLASAADLLDVYRQALGHDAQYAAARAARDAGLEKGVQGRAGLLPVIGASASVTRNHVNPEGLPSSDYNSNAWGVQLTQPLWRKQNQVVAEQGVLQSSLSEVQFEQVRQDLALRVADAYFNVLNAQDALEAVTQLRTAAAEQLELATVSFEVGTVTITDVHEAQSRFDLAQAQVIAAESELELRRDTLFQIVGGDPGELAPLRPAVELSAPTPGDPGQWVTAAEEGGYPVQLQRIARDLAVREFERNRAAHLPTVDLVATAGQAHRQSTAAAPRAASATVGIQFNLPLYAGGALSSREREAAALQVKAESDLENARRRRALAARQAYLGVTSGLARIKALEAAQTSSLSALEANKLGYEVGVRINIDVLNAQTQLADTRQQLARARYDTLLAQLRLKAAAGTLEEGDLEEVNALLAR